MAKNNPGDILTSDWNPVVGCSRYSPGCRDCWWLDGIMPWQIRLKNLPADLKENGAAVLEARFDPAKLRPKKGIVGVIHIEPAMRCGLIPADPNLLDSFRQRICALLLFQPRHPDGEAAARLLAFVDKAG
ncbi:MAG: hypothetical protein FJW30_29695 [Acidobacteria bacterium]|nr:hypothetical protein [Acidobacteriota bacterium]MBM3843876.1 hypothetical protein [Verrucomicrobiota bacterium]